MKKSLMEIDSAHKVYAKQVIALNGVNIKIYNNEIIAILGPSGSGKSTLIKSILGLINLDKGNIYFKGRSHKENKFGVIRNSLATIYQNFNLVSRSSIITNILLGELAKASSWRVLLNVWPIYLQKKALKLLEEVGLKDIDPNKRVENLSGGQQQRVGIARALIGSPEMILADEPVSSLDPQTAKDILMLIKKTAKKNKVSVLCSLHQIDYAKSFADRIVGMRKGKILFDKPSKELKKLDLSKLYE
jgi:phosphonate transport system ATP-binding protein